MISIGMRCIIELIATTGSRSITTCVECEEVVQLQSPGFVRPRQLFQVLTGNIVVGNVIQNLIRKATISTRSLLESIFSLSKVHYFRHYLVRLRETMGLYL